MIYRRLISQWRRRPVQNNHQARHWRRTIPEQHISANALKVLSRLHKSGFTAYLVGGGVRDLLVNKIPKDFDVATNASPEQVRKIFRNSRIIGRRFQIVHVFYPHEIIEVSTFRAQVSEPIVDADQHTKVCNNTFGTVEEDVWRRDFTVNALYYNNENSLVIDFTGGIDDLKKKLIRIIGDPAQRFHEDPVRLLRAIRLAAKLEFKIHFDTEVQLRQLPHLLQHVAKSRLFDEVLKLFFTGHAFYTFQRLHEYNYFSALFPQTAAVMFDSADQRILEFIELSMRETDRRYHQQNSLNPGFLFAVLLWPAIQKLLRKTADKKFYQALRHALEEVLKKQTETLTIPHRLTTMMRSIWLLQYYLIQPRRQRVYRTLFHRYFRAAFDFLALRVKIGEPYQTALNWWEQFRDGDTEERQRLLHQLPKPPLKKEGI